MIIQVAVNVAHSGWSSTRVKNVAKSVDTSVRPKHALKNANLMTFSILAERMLGKIHDNKANLRAFASYELFKLLNVMHHQPSNL